MKRKLSVIVDNGMSGICPALKAHDNIRLLREHIGDLPFSLIAPVGSNDCFYHLIVLLLIFTH